MVNPRKESTARLRAAVTGLRTAFEIKAPPSDLVPLVLVPARPTPSRPVAAPGMVGRFFSALGLLAVLVLLVVLPACGPLHSAGNWLTGRGEYEGSTPGAEIVGDALPGPYGGLAKIGLYGLGTLLGGGGVVGAAKVVLARSRVLPGAGDAQVTPEAPAPGPAPSRPATTEAIANAQTAAIVASGAAPGVPPAP